jgi:hypothetical protein
MLNVAELEGADLDHWVARSLGWERGTNAHDVTGWACSGNGGEYVPLKKWNRKWVDVLTPEFSTVWNDGGPIIEREKINLQYFFKRPKDDHRHEAWSAWSKDGTTEIEGPTALIAAMRCFVASKFGATFDSDTTIHGTLSEGGTVK